ncbi:MAG: glucose 1-dehydrogenase [Alphaproteobacteria bacterium]|jgi:3(or 17)beta-hydroxysteroid dehydrogenase|nr:glucose 1-dehydrogenase [Alphaproteobacteria bacterium]
MSDRVAGKVALVTGGGSGIGRASSLTLAREGATVVVTDMNEDTAAETASLIAKAGGKARFMAQDTTDEGVWRTVITSIRETEKRLDVVVNNAGISAGRRLLKDTTLEHWRAVNSVNMEGVYLGTKYGIELMEEAGNGGSIINISSIYGKVGAIGSVSYSASKGAVCVMSKGAALECGNAGNGVRVNTIHPGYILTGMNEDRLTQGEFRDLALKRKPIGRIGEPRDIANGVLYLASDESSFVTGTELIIDGGFLAV